MSIRIHSPKPPGSGPRQHPFGRVREPQPGGQALPSQEACDEREQLGQGVAREAFRRAKSKGPFIVRRFELKTLLRHKEILRRSWRSAPAISKTPIVRALFRV